MLSRVLILAVSVVDAAMHPELSELSFDTYKLNYGKSYASDSVEHHQRQDAFKENLEIIVAHNKQYAAGKHTWFMGVNQFTDMTAREFREFLTLKQTPAWRPQKIMDVMPDAPNNPASVDWREHNAVTPVKNQGACGSCWAFSAAEVMESHLAIASGKLLELSPQAYVNCVPNPRECGGTGGCHGATPQLAYNLSETHGLPLAADVPYAGVEAACSSYTPAVVNSAFVTIQPNSALALETALATKGPISVSVAAGQFQHYEGGVFSGCSAANDGDVNHAVVAVGYTKEAWIVRNSWGTGWGEAGYILISREADSQTFVDKAPADGTVCKADGIPDSLDVVGECGVLSDSSYPVGVSLPSTTAVVV